MNEGRTNTKEGAEVAKTYEQLMQGDDVISKTGATIQQWERELKRWRSDDWHILGFTVRCPREEGDDYLVTIRLENGGARWVAFQSGETLGSVLIRTIRAIRNNKLKMREDQYEQGED